MQSLDNDEKVLVKVKTAGGEQNVLHVTETGLYKIIFTARSDVAKRFQKWVCTILKDLRMKGVVKLADQHRHKMLLDEYYMHKHCVYLGKAGEVTGTPVYKIGKTTCLKTRYLDLKLQFPNFQFVHVIEVSDIDGFEKHLHSKFKDHKYNFNKCKETYIFDIKKLTLDEVVQTMNKDKWLFDIATSRNQQIVMEYLKCFDKCITAIVHNENADQYTHLLDKLPSYETIEKLVGKDTLKDVQHKTIVSTPQAKTAEIHSKQENLELVETQITSQEDDQKKQDELLEEQITSEQPNIETKPSNRAQKVFKCSSDRQIVSVYNTIKQARQANQFKYSETQIREAAKNCTLLDGFRWVFSFDDTPEIPETQQSCKAHSKTYDYFAILDNVTHEILEVFPTQKEVAQYLDVSPALVNKKVKDRTTCNGKLIHAWESLPDESKIAYLQKENTLPLKQSSQSKSIVRVDPNTKEETVYGSIIHATDTLKLARRDIIKAINNNSTFRGYEWKWVAAQ